MLCNKSITSLWSAISTMIRRTSETARQNNKCSRQGTRQDRKIKTRSGMRREKDSKTNQATRQDRMRDLEKVASEREVNETSQTKIEPRKRRELIGSDKPSKIHRDKTYNNVNVRKGTKSIKSGKIIS